MSPSVGFVDASGQTLSGSGIVLEPAGTQFRTPGVLTITFPYEPTNAVLYSGSGEGEDLHPVMASVEGDTIIASVPHFTVYRIDAEGAEYDKRSCEQEALPAWQLWKFGKLAAPQRTFAAFRKIFSDYLKAVERERIDPAKKDEVYLFDAMVAMQQWSADVKRADKDAARLVTGWRQSLFVALQGEISRAKKMLAKAFKSGIERGRDRCFRTGVPIEGFKVRHYAELANTAFEFGLADQLNQAWLGQTVQDCLQLRWGFTASTLMKCGPNGCLNNVNTMWAAIASPRNGWLIYDFDTREWVEVDLEGWVLGEPSDVGSAPASGMVEDNRTSISHLASLSMEDVLKAQVYTNPHGCRQNYFDFELKSVRPVFSPRGAFDFYLGTDNLHDLPFWTAFWDFMNLAGYETKLDTATSTVGFRLEKVAGPGEPEGWKLVHSEVTSDPFAAYTFGKAFPTSDGGFVQAFFKVRLYYEPGDAWDIPSVNY
jgi:hypothetical protein